MKGSPPEPDVLPTYDWNKLTEHKVRVVDIFSSKIYRHPGLTSSNSHLIKARLMNIILIYSSKLRQYKNLIFFLLKVRAH